ncbi:MAG: RDD family protein [Verrucomicrobia bacterium]|nr:RDD family protein [Verrucomicrobiota bacterium]
MKTYLFPPSFRAVAALGLLLSLAAGAQEKPAPPPDTPATPAEAAAAPAAPVPATAPESVAPAPAEPPLRRLDAAPDSGGKTEKSAPAKRRREARPSGKRNDAPFGDHVVAEGSRASEAVSIMGSTVVNGEVMSDAVSVLGSTVIGPNAKVGGAAVAVLGPLTSQGSIGQDAVSVLGGAEINGPVKGEVVCVLGDLNLGPNAVVERDIVLVGGRLTKHPQAVVHGGQVNVPGFGGLGDLAWLTTWIKRCVFMARPLAFGEHLGWAWGVALSFLGFYLLLALVFRSGIDKCVTTLETRPGASVLTAFLTVLLSPVATVLLIATVVGLIVVPFLAFALFLAKLFGKAVMLAWLGRRITRYFGDGPLNHPFFAVLVGGAIVLLLYTVPVFGFLLYKVLSWLGLGVVVFTIALAMRRETPPPAAVGAGEAPLPPVPGGEMALGVVPPSVSTPVSAATPVEAPAPVGDAVPRVSPGFTGTAAVEPPLPPSVPSYVPPPAPAALPPMASAGFAAGAAAPGPVPAAPPPPASALRLARTVPPVALPRAGFWIRLGALALDGILIAILVQFTTHLLPRFLQFNTGPGGILLPLAAYAAIMWKHRGTTIGGIICGLKVVRLDARELDWTTVVVRALGCFLSLFVAGLGFIWVAFDAEKQSWHDKIAGTTVVHVPKGTSLL